MDDLLKNLRALAKGKHDDYTVALEAVEEIETLRLRVSEMLDLLRELMEHLYVVSDEDDTKADELISWGIKIRDRLEGEINEP